MPMLDRTYSGEEIGEIAARATNAMGDIPGIVKLAAHAAAASTMMEEVEAVGRLSPDFQRAAGLLHAIAELFLLVCQTGPVSVGTKQ